jgi:hypothetical protein
MLVTFYFKYLSENYKREHRITEVTYKKNKAGLSAVQKLNLATVLQPSGAKTYTSK